MTEEELIKRCKNGSHEAFEALYNKYAKRMMAIAIRYCNTTFEAEDIVQETFIKIFEKINTYQDKGSFEGWLKKILIRHSINHFHKTSKTRGFEDSAELEIADESTNHLFSAFSAHDLLNLLKQLPVGYKTVFNLYAIEGYSHKEIAELCHINEGTSRSQLAKAKGMLKALVVKNSYVSNEK